MQHAVTQIREAIIDGRFGPGARLVELELARTLGLSRGPVREALRELSREGLVELRANRGAIVTSITSEDIIEVYAVRSTLGSLALRVLLSAGPPAPEVLRRFEKLAAKTRTAARRSQAAMVEADLAFQRAFADETSLPRLTRQFDESTAEVRTFVNRLKIEYPNVEQILDDHSRLIEALRRGDLATADRTWRERFLRSVQEFVSLLPDGVDSKPSTRALLAVLNG
jgi:DNA-binding GntR family transcriptional regulator